LVLLLHAQRALDVHLQGLVRHGGHLVLHLQRFLPVVVVGVALGQPHQSLEPFVHVRVHRLGTAVEFEQCYGSSPISICDKI